MVIKKIAPLFFQLVRFGCVGIAAALIHFFTVVFLVEQIQFTPLKANVLAFSLAFWVSYFGHRWITFPTTFVCHQKAIPRFFCVALLGFSLNQTLYSLLLNGTDFGYKINLIIVLAIVPLVVFCCSKFFVFHSKS